MDVIETPVQRYYRRQAFWYDKTRWMFLRGRTQAVAQLTLQASDSVLEIGCGTGLNFRRILKHLDSQAGRLVGVDFSQSMLSRAQRRVERAGWNNVQLIQADAATMEIPQRFDAVFLAYSLTMIPDWRHALEKSAHHLKPNGRLVVLDFGNFERWGLLGRGVRTWLHWNHVQTGLAVADCLGTMFDSVQTRPWWGGYASITVARKL